MKNMKKTTALIFAAVAIALSGCYVTQEMQEGASFEGLKKIYVEQPFGTAEVFSQMSDVGDIDVALKKAIVDYLKTKGFTAVENKADAQIVFRPLWNSSFQQPDTYENDGRSVNSTSVGLPIGTNAVSDLYATLEIQAILPDSGDIWSWRGFSPTELSIKNFTIGQIYDNVVWCLQYFPPEDHPATIEIIKSEIAEKKAKSEENPFKEVLIKEREKQEQQSALPQPTAAK